MDLAIWRSFIRDYMAVPEEGVIGLLCLPCYPLFLFSSASSARSHEHIIPLMIDTEAELCQTE